MHILGHKVAFFSEATPLIPIVRSSPKPTPQRSGAVGWLSSLWFSTPASSKSSTSTSTRLDTLSRTIHNATTCAINEKTMISVKIMAESSREKHKAHIVRSTKVGRGFQCIGQQSLHMEPYTLVNLNNLT